MLQTFCYQQAVCGVAVDDKLNRKGKVAHFFRKCQLFCAFFVDFLVMRWYKMQKPAPGKGLVSGVTLLLSYCFYQFSGLLQAGRK